MAWLSRLIMVALPGIVPSIVLAQAPAPAPAPAPATAPAPAPDQPLLKAEELDQLLAPIALYPDPLLSQVLMASTYPLEVVQAERHGAGRPDDHARSGGARARRLPGGLLRETRPHVPNLRPVGCIGCADPVRHADPPLTRS